VVKHKPPDKICSYFLDVRTNEPVNFDPFWGKT